MLTVSEEAVMKGRRKVVNHKWSLQALIEVETKRKFERRSKKSAHRFLNAALTFGKEFEPTGRLAGGPDALIVGENYKTSPSAQGVVNLVRTLDLAALLDETIEVVIRAGQLLIDEWARIDGPRGKGDKAEVDLEIEHLLRRQLLDLFPCDFWGEETGNCLNAHPWCWVVDPNDGTSDFLNGNKGSALSVGLLYEQTPVLGVVYAPVTNEGVPDCIAWAEGLTHVLRNGHPVTANLSAKTLSAREFVMVSSAASNKPRINSELCKPGRFIPMPSIAYRLAKVAAGEGVCGVSLYPVSAHDVAAGHALLRGAGGVLLNERGESISYVMDANMHAVARRCFGGSPSASKTLCVREWGRIFT
jgi:fructose-1,6-bisphosphatase/inositol monophosphatase family enzyme